jgi:hypothetical protein
MTATSPSPLQLQARQRVWERVPPGADLQVEQGRICLHQRLYLAHDWAYMPVYLQAGERYRVSAGGWMEIEALDDAQLRLLPRRGWRQLWAAGRLHRWFGGLQAI